jgi:hypothetical protein
MRLLDCRQSGRSMKLIARNYDALFAVCLLLVSCLAYTLTLKVVEIRSSDVDIQWTTWRYIQEEHILGYREHILGYLAILALYSLW